MSLLQCTPVTNTGLTESAAKGFLEIGVPI